MQGDMHQSIHVIAFDAQFIHRLKIKWNINFFSISLVLSRALTATSIRASVPVCLAVCVLFMYRIVSVWFTVGCWTRCRNEIESKSLYRFRNRITAPLLRICLRILREADNERQNSKKKNNNKVNKRYACLTGHTGPIRQCLPFCQRSSVPVLLFCKII